MNIEQKSADNKGENARDYTNIDSIELVKKCETPLKLIHAIQDIREAIEKEEYFKKGFIIIEEDKDQILKELTLAEEIINESRLAAGGFDVVAFNNAYARQNEVTEDFGIRKKYIELMEQKKKLFRN